jgi:hypothetical protein
MFATAMALTPSEAPSNKIGPGYARMQPINQGRPDAVIYIPPYSIPVRARAEAVKRPPVNNIADLSTEIPAPVVVATTPASYIRPDIHRIY